MTAPRLHHLLDDGTGRTRPALARLAWELTSMPVPYRGLAWLDNNPLVSDYLRGLARGTIPLTHQGLHDLDSWRTAAHLRDLLMATGALPAVDRQIMQFERWCLHRLTEITDPEHAQFLRGFARWRLLPHLHSKARRGPVGVGSRNWAAGSLNSAAVLLTWLSDRGTTLKTMCQADLDVWFAAGPDPHRTRAFLRWAMTTGHASRMVLPTARRAPVAPISQDRRLHLLRRFLTEDTIDLRTRVAACLILLFAQTITRLLRLTLDDLLDQDERMFLRLGTPPTPVPKPFAALVRDLADQRANMNTAANPQARWLFPGGRAGQPLSVTALSQHLQALGFPTVATRTSAFRQLVLQAPAPVIADALGYRHSTATKHFIAAGGSWSRYAPRR
ncbi:hypothetical protein GT755_29475 [Herbidospora sp. NEAU-GS84]|uniref:Integrase n=1 Tax=Herbidospora solisilvae TaxID=2696284 RepID=A0A7C9J7B4_9ACTN|nr:hypothetical protein [Herbidospora solisilvae]NAS25800.1 hypothetical protein [Herbidospora solisilvae]